MTKIVMQGKSRGVDHGAEVEVDSDRAAELVAQGHARYASKATAAKAAKKAEADAS